ncbi:hypothetical protein ACFL0V_03970 [Nanoarchaeota archaeon]
MTDIEEHHKEFQQIIQKYRFSDEKKAIELAEFLTSHHGKKITPKEFSEKFHTTEQEATIFLSFIERGLNFKKNFKPM